MAKNKKSEFKLRRSEVQTPEVMGYMKKLWEDEGGLNFYEREHEHEHEVSSNTPHILLSPPPTTNTPTPTRT